MQVHDSTPASGHGATPASAAAPGSDRRALLGTVGLVAAVGGAYAAFAAIFGRFLYPARATDRGWLLIAPTGELPDGSAVVYRLPDGQPVNVTRAGSRGTVDDFVALSSTCPHLGCQVHWEPHNTRYFCPCHNGTFDPSGKGTGGPPGDAGQSLPRFPLKVERGMLFIEVPMTIASLGPGSIDTRPRGPCGPGHDPCLSCRETLAREV